MTIQYISILAIIIVAYFIIYKINYFRRQADNIAFIKDIYFKMMCVWMAKKNAGKKIGDYLSSQLIYNIAIYGAGTLGELLFQELKDYDKVKVRYFIDRTPIVEFEGLPCIPPERTKEMAHIDGIIITPVYDYDYIKKTLINMGNFQVISLDDIIYELK